MRVGFGYDIHKLVPGRNLVLGGVKIPSPLGEDGHSDGDVLIHALIDALLGSTGLGDIGTLFPNSDQKYKDISSRTLLEQVMVHLAGNHWHVINADTTVVLEEPKISPFSGEMRRNLAQDLDLPVEDVSVKAKTKEGMDAAGAGKAIEAYAIVLLENNIPKWDTIVSLLWKQTGKSELPSVSKIARKKRDPFRVLVSTMISLRTKDEVTLTASTRLFQLADSPGTMANLSEQEIARAIYPAGFYKTKAKHILKVCRILLTEYAGSVPGNLEALLTLPGVGRKTANLVLNLGFGMDAICVDTHVHRISNRTGWIETKNPEETEYALMEILPRNYWIKINELLVTFGQTICSPQSPFCSKCLIEDFCEKRGVTRSR